METISRAKKEGRANKKQSKEGGACKQEAEQRRRGVQTRSRAKKEGHAKKKQSTAGEWTIL